ncbi:hypothetical protein BGX24_002714 [Mortierella sp. AD032]|nr:hypothetical protein BGX24_002714 [Mortierella sp. AD032]
MVETNPETDTFFQAFRSETEQRDVLIPVVRHPTLNELYVIWTDITDCFPRASRIQHNDEFVPFLRDSNLSRVKPFGIQYYPGAVLEVVLGDRLRPSPKRRANVRPRNANTQSNTTANNSTSIINSNNNITSTSNSNITSNNGNSNGSSRNNRNGHAGNTSNTYLSKLSGPSNGGDNGAANQQGELSTGPTVNDKDVNGDSDEKRIVTEKQEVVAVNGSGAPTNNGSVPQAASTTDQQAAISTEKPRGRLSIPAEISTDRSHTIIAASTRLDGGLAGQKAVWTAIAESYGAEVSRTRSPRFGSIEVTDLVEHRVETILKDRFSWTQSGHPRFYCFLPILPDPGPEFAIREAPDFSDAIQSDTKFQLYYLCDCGDIPGFQDRWYPHWNINDFEHYRNNVTGESTTQEQLEDIIPLVGTFIVAVLEMLKHGVYINDKLMIQPQVHPDSQRRISLAIRYFESKGIQSCEGFWKNPTAGGDRSETFGAIKSPLHEHAVDFWRIAEKNRWVRLSELFPYKTRDGDVRWVCQSHWHAMTDLGDLHRATEFSKNPQSTKSEYKIAQGSFITEIVSMQRAREFFQLAERMTSTIVLRVSLDWDLTTGDEDELHLLIGRLSATALHLTVRRKNRCPSGVLMGFASGYVQLTLAAIWNPNIEIFMLLPRPPADEPDYSAYYERHYMISSCNSLSSDTIATLMKQHRGAPARAILHASDIDLAVNSIRKLAKGFHYFNELQLTKESIQANAIIRFRSNQDPENPVKGDPDYNSGDLFKFFEQREWIDDIECDCSEAVITQLLLMHNLTRVIVWFSLKHDRVKIRELLKVNKKLKELTLHDTERDDPSQIFETYKALLANHPTIELFEVRQHHIDTADSTFAWKNPKEPTKMRVAITCYAGDRVQSMLQKYAPLIDSLTIEHLKASDAAVLEKSTRPKKGPLSLRWLGIHNVHLMEAAVLDDLKKVILRSDIDQVMVTGSTFKVAILLDDATLMRSSGAGARGTAAKGGGAANKMRDDVAEEKANVQVWAEFIMAIRTKLTDMSISTKDPANLLGALEAQVVEGEQPDMIRLQGFTMTGAWTQSILLYPWMERLLLSTGHGATATNLEDGRRKQILIKLTLTGSTILEEDWKRILKSLDLFQMTRIHIRQKNRLSVETLKSMIDAIPMDSPSLRQYLVDDSQVISAEISRAFEAKMKTKSEKFHTTVILQSLHMS